MKNLHPTQIHSDRFYESQLYARVYRGKYGGRIDTVNVFKLEGKIPSIGACRSTGVLSQSMDRLEELQKQ